MPKKFSSDHKAVIDRANLIFDEYAAAGFVLTLRQAYYRFVAGGFLDSLGFKPDPHTGSTNCEASYKRLGGILNDARLAGLIDWEMMEDRTRSLKQQASWQDPPHIISAVADQFRIDKWATQKYRPEIFVEKDALVGVFERVCNELQVPYFSCRGYTSQSEMWVAGQRLSNWIKRKQKPYILHFGDHDPSGIDMTRDIKDRLEMFMGGVKLDRLALNMDQVEEFNPPSNPAKITDSRAAGYIAEFGDESWELDALPPEVLATLVRDAITAIRDEDKWAAAVEEEEEHRRLLGVVSERWQDLTEDL